MMNKLTQIPLEGRLCRLLFTTCVALALLLPAAAQETPDEDILLDLLVNYGVAFREGSWVPVDVLVSNTEKNVDGFVEIRTYDFSGTLQSPVYRVPADSPKGSQKRFRLHCKLERSDRLEARLYDGNRPVSPVPARLNLTPIDRNDYLGLVMDDLHHDYGFLSSGVVIGRSDTRFHREGLDTSLLGYLADHLPCFTTFDLIVMGNVDPEKVSPYHRGLITQYVALGGSLVVSLGQNATQYKGTWLEPLMGVTIGENTFLSEEALASRAFGSAEDRAGATAAREGMATQITPNSPDVESIGNNFAIGALNPLGSGRVATFTVDATSGLLQNNTGYLNAWNQLLDRSIVDRPLNLPAAIEAATQQLPSIAGVKLFPVSSVIAYLLLYFFLAIVANWLFWNWMKRREMAWVCLVFFSFAFTGYAMFFGTQGRARTTELEQLEILEMSSGAPVATMHGITGLLAKGSGRFDAVLSHPDSLVSDAARTQFLGMQQPGGIFGPQSENPFQFVQAETGRIEGLTVGASEMRFLQTQAPINLDGALESDLTMEGDDVRGEIRNNTGVKLANPILLYQGRATRLEFVDGVAQVALDSPNRGTGRMPNISAPPPDAITAPGDMNHNERAQFTSFLTNLPPTVLNHRGASLPPCLVAWASQEPFGSIEMGDRAQIRLGATLVVGWLEVKRTTMPAEQRLAIEIVNEGYGAGTYAPDPDGQIETEAAWREHAMFLDSGTAWEVDIAIPDWMRGAENYAVELTVLTDNCLYDGYHPQCSIRRGALDQTKLEMNFADPDNNMLTFGAPKVRSTELSSQCTLTTKVYTIDNWQSLMPPRATALSLVAWPSDDDYAPGRPARGTNRRAYGTNVYSQPVQQHHGARHYHALFSARMIQR